MLVNGEIYARASSQHNGLKKWSFPRCSGESYIPTIRGIYAMDIGQGLLTSAEMCGPVYGGVWFQPTCEVATFALRSWTVGCGGRAETERCSCVNIWAFREREGLPVLLEVVLPLEALPADLAGEGELGRFVRPFVDHEVVWFGEAALAVLADVLALGPHLAPELAPAVLVLNLHYGEHGCCWLCRCLLMLLLASRCTAAPYCNLGLGAGRSSQPDRPSSPLLLETHKHNTNQSLNNHLVYSNTNTRLLLRCRNILRAFSCIH